MANQYTPEQREKLVAEVRASGERVSVIARRMGISSSSAYLWMKKSMPARDAPVFARVVPVRAASLRLEVAGAAVVVERGFDPELLLQVIATLSRST
jgi:transposase-like protein